MNLAAILQWLGLLQQIEQKGAAVFASVKKALADHGIEADTSALDEVIADAARRKALAEREAGIASAAALGVSTGSTGE